jgi:phenylpropionate dioxygenase-like ring-hydroxylating dioxygenase large terminal subunit
MIAGTGWYPVALADGLEAGTSFGTRVHGREVVVWRDAEGNAHVWEDRCPHRGMRLSFGFVRGGHLACLYHGWQFDAAGQCRLIPAHPDIAVPSTIRATRARSVESLGIVWMQAPDETEREAPAENGPTTPVRTLTIDAAPTLVIAHIGGGDEAERIDIGGLSVIAAMQPLSSTETALHLVIDGSHGSAERKAVSAWGVALRSRLERAA